MALSTRAQDLSKPDPKFLFWDILQDIWDPDDNPNGFVSLGVAENVLMHDVLSEHMHRNMAVPNQDFTYGDGKKRLKRALAGFLTRYLHPVVPIEPSHLTVSNGCSSALEHASWAFGNPGDVFLLGKPYYGTFVPDMTLRMGTHLATVDFCGADPLGDEAVVRYEAALLGAQAEGKRVAGLILAHPHNPLGRSYPRRVLVQLMQLCQKYGVNLISDEIYALSTFTNTIDGDVEAAKATTPFESVLAVDTNGIIDPALVHVIWGVSKDFGANGLRVGVIVSQRNEALHRALVPPSLYSSSSSISDHVVANMLEDEAWVDDYIERNRRKLAEGYEHVVRWARKHGIKYAPGVNAAFFLWVELGSAYRRGKKRTREEGQGGEGTEGGEGEAEGNGDNIDSVVHEALLREKVFLASGSQFGSEKPGWFRIVFTQRRDHLDRGLERIVAAMGIGGPDQTREELASKNPV